MPDYRNTPELQPDWYREPWVALVRAAYEADGPAATARRLGVSPSMVTAVARGYYAHSLDTIRRAALEALTATTVGCPVLGELALAECRRHREAPFRASNPLAARLWRACRSCPHNPSAES